MLNERIIALMREFNPWWENKEISIPNYKRHIFAEVEKYMKTKQIIAIVGLRRVGKTVLMKQIIRELPSSVKKENVFYFLFDELIGQKPEVLEDILDYYLKTIAKDGKKYIFLDEIQKVPYWQEILKRFYDTRGDLKFVVSGSASLQIKKSKESLAGRIFDFHMPVLTFREFLELNGFDVEKAELNFKSLKKIYERNLHKKAAIEKMFLEYIFKGAFPEIAIEEDEQIIKNYIRSSVIEKIILEDIPAVFDVKKKDILSAMMEYCSRETSNLIEISNLAKTLGINYETARSYIFYLQKSFIIDILYNYSKSTAKQLRKNKKIHIAHPSITITIMGHSKDSLRIEELVGKFVETVIFQHAKLLSERIFFWRTPQKDEVDVVLEIGRAIPIEVKYRSRIGLADSASVEKFMKLYKSKEGIIVTRDFFQEEKINGRRILFVPAWLFLMVI